jgi:IS1 family transposase
MLLFVKVQIFEDMGFQQKERTVINVVIQNVSHDMGEILAYVLSGHKDEAFLMLKELLKPFGITQYYTDGWGAYERHIEARIA